MNLKTILKILKVKIMETTNTNTNNEIMEAKTYLQLISQEKEETKKEEMSLIAQEAALQLNQDKFNVSKKIQEIKMKINKVKRNIPYSVSLEFVLSKELEALEEKLKFIEDIKEERFSDINF